MDRLFPVCRIRRWPPGRSTFPVAGFNTPDVLRRRSAVSLLPMATSSQLGWLLLGCSVSFEVFSALRGCAELRVEVETALTLRFDYDRPHGLGADQVIWGGGYVQSFSANARPRGRFKANLLALGRM